MKQRLNKGLSVALAILLVFTMLVPAAFAEGVLSSELQIDEETLVEETELGNSVEEEEQHGTNQSTEGSVVNGELEKSLEVDQSLQKETLVQAASDNVTAKELDFNIIKNIILNDESDVDLTQKESIKKNSKAIVIFEYKLPNGTVFRGDTFTFKLPDELQALQGTFNLEAEDELGNKLKDGDGNEYSFGTGVVKDGQVTITFSEHVEQDNVAGNFKFGVQFVEEKIGDKNPIPIVFELKAESKEVKLNFEQYQKVEPTITKKYTAFNKQKNIITWEVEVKAGSEDISAVEFIDSIQADQVYVEKSFKVDNTSVDPTVESSLLSYTFDKIAKNSKKKITFQTKIKETELPAEDRTKTYTNSAAIQPQGYNTPIESNKAEINVTTDIIQKSGSATKSFDGITKIDWEITINKDLQTITSERETLKLVDELPAGLLLDQESLKILEDNSDVTSDTEMGSFTVNEAGFAYIFKKNLTGKQYKVKYTTTVSDRDFLISGTSKNFTNEATLYATSIVNGSASASTDVGVSPNRISKSGLDYNRSTHEITWKIDVNNDNVSLKNVVVTDDIPEGQTFVENSISAIQGTSCTYSDDKITCQLGDITSKQSITFKTTVDSNEHYATNGSIKYFNQAELMHSKISTPDKSIVASVDVVSNVVKKAVAESYDYNERTIKWKLTINENKMPLTNIVVVDNIPEGHEYVTDSAVTSIENIGEFSYDGKKLTFTATKDKEIKDQFNITFTTKVSEPDDYFKTNGNIRVQNKASIQASEIPGTVESNVAAVTISNTIAKKGGNFDEENKSITWTVEVNPNRITLPSTATIKDSLQEGLELDIDSVKLYEAAIDSKTGALAKDKEITLENGNIQYDGRTRQFDFTFPEETGNTQNAYILEFNTDVMKQGTYSNTVIFNGTGSDETGKSNEVGISLSQMSGTGTGNTKTVKLVKVNKDNLEEKLAGAEFELWMVHPRLNKEVYVRTVNSGTDGEVLLDRLRSEIDYVLKEVKAPIGYQLNDEPFTFKLKTEDETVLLNDEPLKAQYEFENEKIKADIELLKKGKDDQPLAGAEFTIYAKNDTENAITTAISGIDGKVVFEKMPLGEYVIRETKAPIGYNLSNQVLNATVTSSEAVKANPDEIVNERIKGKIQFYKVNSSGQPLAEAEFTLYDENGKEIATSVSTEAGLVEFKDVEYGDYKIRETKAPKGYQRSSKTVSVTVDGTEGQIYSVANFVNYRYVQPSPIQGTVKLIKTDEDREPLAGAEFELYNANGIKVGTAISNVDGIVQFVGVEHGTYTLKETKAPVGYHLLSEALEVKVNGTEGQVYDLGAIKNSKIKGTIELVKVNELGKPLVGAEFTLYTDEKKVATATSNEDGIAQFIGVEYGSYTVKETKAPEGYQLTSQVLEVKVDGKEGQVYNLGSIQNSKIKGTIEILKTDEAGNPLAGAEFILYAEDGSEVAKQVSNSEGVVLFTAVPYGKYSIKESIAPAGYILNTEMLNITITKEIVYTFTVINKKEDIKGPGIDPEPIHPDNGSGTDVDSQDPISGGSDETDDSKVESVTDSVQGNSGTGSGSNKGATSNEGSRNPQVDSGTLPETGSPYYNYLLIGSIVGAMGIVLLTVDRLRRRKAEM